VTDGTTRKCPPWCVTDHGRGTVTHAGRRADIQFPGRGDALDFIDACPVWFRGLPGPQVLVSSLRCGHDTPSPYLAVAPDDAAALAAIIDMLAAAKPAQHRELAGAIRAAAARITEGNDG
jgi:hypothetical protein